MSCFAHMLRFPRVILIVLLLLGSWIFVYVLNTINGGYYNEETSREFDVVTQRLKYSVYIKWQPLFGRLSTNNSDIVGIMFSPLIKIDRRCFHTSIDMTTNEGFRIASTLPLKKVHPDLRKEVEAHRARKR